MRILIFTKKYSISYANLLQSMLKYYFTVIYGSYSDDEDDDGDGWNFGTVKTQPAFNDDTASATAGMHDLSLAPKKKVDLHY